VSGADRPSTAEGNTMTPLPHHLAARYRFATSHEIRSRSFGVVRERRVATSGWREYKSRDQRGTLDDQAIFGPVRDCECACGKYRGAEFRGMICDVCGVKLTSPTVRRRRFGHIDLVSEIQHPLAKEPHRLSVFPVLPADLISSPAGISVAAVYEELVALAAMNRAEPPVAILGRLVERSEAVLARLVDEVLPMVLLAAGWRLPEATVLARGLALKPQEQEIETGQD
jgi:hypothetical protein